MKLIKVTTDLKVTTHEFPTGTYKERNRRLRELIGNGCETYEHVMPKRLYERFGMENTPTRIPGQCVSMLVDEEFLLKENVPNLAGCYLYGTDDHGHPIMGNILFVGEEWGEEGIDFCGIEESTFQTLEGQLKKLTRALSEEKRCPRCGHTKIQPHQNFCVICGLDLREKENVPTARQSTCGDKKKLQIQNTEKWGGCQMEKKDDGIL